MFVAKDKWITRIIDKRILNVFVYEASVTNGNI